MQASWKTTALGIVAAAMILLMQATAWLDDDPATTLDWNEVVGAIMAAGAVLGIGVSARDDKITSEQSGAKTAAAKGTAVG